jgi:deazaflavin-dependent oxidoreductase (nitroreductase family)
MAEPPSFPWPIRVLHRFNPLIVQLLRSPLHGLMSKELLVLEYRGRKTGKPYATPLAYVTVGGHPCCVTRRHTNWWRNAVDSADPVTVWLRGERWSAVAERLSSDSTDASSSFIAFLAANPGTARMVYHVRVGKQRQPDPADVAREIHESVVVRLRRSSRS